LGSPLLDRHFVALRGPLLRFLLGKAQRVQHAADMVAVVLHAIPFANDLRHAAAGPQVVAKAGGQRAGPHDLG
jgi:hypothetical protein